MKERRYVGLSGGAAQRYFFGCGFRMGCQVADREEVPCRNGGKMSKGSGFFSLESPIYKFMTRLLDMLVLNFLWLFFSGLIPAVGINYLTSYAPLVFLPVVLGMGAATTAAFSVTLKMVDEREGYIFTPFLRAYKENYGKGTILGIIFLVAVCAIRLDFSFYKAAKELNQSSTGFLVVGIIASVLAFLHLIYAFALQARYENTIINTLKNSFSIAVKYILKTLFLLVVLTVLILFFLWNSTFLLIGILLGPGCLILTISSWAMQAFRLIEGQNAQEG